MNNYSQLIEDLKEYNIVLSDEQLNQFDQYFNLLIEWNQKMNLTAITEFNDVCKLHFLDSISACQYFDFTQNDLHIIDIGTGAGFPGIPLKIVFPNLNVTLFDSLQKRLNFLNEVIEQLHLNNDCGKIETVHGRAEDYAAYRNGELREKYDLAVSRAVANLATLSEFCLPYVKVGGQFICYKGEKIFEELPNGKKAIHLLGGRFNDLFEFELPNSDIKRYICVSDKVEKTSKNYPRKAGIPAKNPLC
ncbi:MAG: 16S rRNA (guanine(527)-N(7))-methyltransferase RsmG [Butyrivibrio sp.]|jgi:16S rRNA (guanine527-N7)-methyltransferase|nr:16S rRNA (guanine(527)-N(7))-methyltransferase RsmG [Butyrivibrio sp.]